MKSLTEIKDHWESWAATFGDGLRATTRSSNIKKLEIKALKKMILKHANKDVSELSVLEVGCGNGFNSISLAKTLGCRVDGFDFIPEMISSAISNRDKTDKSLKNRVNFKVGDVLNLDKSKPYDIVFSCRCLINLPTVELQSRAILELSELIDDNGSLMLLENFVDNHSKQNNLREFVGLPRRDVADFNNFFSYSELCGLLSESDLYIEDESNFASLHDVMQYVIVPLMTSGKSDYDHEVMESVTNLLLNIDDDSEDSFGDYGQNKLVVIKRA